MSSMLRLKRHIETFGMNLSGSYFVGTLDMQP